MIVVCVFAGLWHLFFDHELVTLHDELQFVPLGPQGGERVSAGPGHGPEQPVLLLSRLELRKDLHTDTTYTGLRSSILG